jgi:hypothetical protein
MQQNINLWAGGQSNGIRGNWAYKSIAEPPANLTTDAHSGGPHILERVDKGEGRRTLGVRLAPDGTNKAE